ncbi:MAG: oxygen-independent coproporphyrinogen III oxidase [Clostridiales bacterium]|nr:oxygen-independent coproporphyrinogen III oxidase [Clostridiales bacterium]
MSWFNKKEISVYIHVPFCVRKCLYCDFNSFPGKEEYFEAYKNAVVSEINAFGKADEYIVKTIFLGGGTPSVMPREFTGDILNSILSKFKVDPNAEISMEVNPRTVDFDKLKGYREYGVNRLSVGVQSFSERLLKILGRIHDRRDFFECFELIQRAGFKNVNFDLMFALPSQTIDEWEETVKTAVSLSPSHLSVYSLIIEEGTPFFDMYKKGELMEVSDEDDRKMYYMAREILKENGFYQYEISNFSKNGFECRHNIVYWKRKEYIGFGLGACSFFDNERRRNNVSLLDYIAGDWFGEKEDFTERDAFAEFMFLGLRMTKGVLRKDFYNYFGVNMEAIFGKEIKKLSEQGLLSDDGERISLTKRGIDISNVVFREFL